MKKENIKTHLKVMSTMKNDKQILKLKQSNKLHTSV